MCGIWHLFQALHVCSYHGKTQNNGVTGHSYGDGHNMIMMLLQMSKILNVQHIHVAVAKHHKIVPQ